MHHGHQAAERTLVDAAPESAFLEAEQVTCGVRRLLRLEGGPHGAGERLGYRGDLGQLDGHVIGGGVGLLGAVGDPADGFLRVLVVLRQAQAGVVVPAAGLARADAHLRGLLHDHRQRRRALARHRQQLLQLEPGKSLRLPRPERTGQALRQRHRRTQLIEVLLLRRDVPRGR